MGKSIKLKQSVKGPVSVSDVGSNQHPPPDRPRINPMPQAPQAAKLTSVPDGYFPLVVKDQLYYRILLQPTKLGDPHVPIRDQNPLFKQVDGTFRPAFDRIWNALPQQDRRCILGRWRNYIERAYFPNPTVFSVPSIHVFDVTSWSDVAVLAKWSSELNFPLQIVLEQPHALPDVIATVLAMIQFGATERCHDLMRSMVDDPWEAWEAGPGKDADEATVDAEDDRQHAIFRPHYEKEVKKLVKAWGFKARFIDDATLGSVRA